MAKKALTLHMEGKIIDDFRNFCKLNALKMSGKIELLMKREMENAPSNPTLVRLFEELISKQNLKKAAVVPEQSKVEEYKPKVIMPKVPTETKEAQPKIEVYEQEPKILQREAIHMQGFGEQEQQKQQQQQQQQQQQAQNEVKEDREKEDKIKNKPEEKKRVPTIDHLRRLRGL
ncbi:hypothetical protein KY330_01625 [Candidatus Woesearchaeota archaeon]|nr:hypothetical protein [Candidatus Woesearchaeota archaeon]